MWLLVAHTHKIDNKTSIGTVLSNVYQNTFISSTTENARRDELEPGPLL